MHVATAEFLRRASEAQPILLFIDDLHAADVPSLLDAWRRGMAHLRDANVFATPEMAPSYAVHWTRGANARLRRDG